VHWRSFLNRFLKEDAMSAKTKHKTSKLPDTPELKHQEVVQRPPSELKPWPDNARLHDERQLAADGDGNISGHAK
jgi:hypothetical protein